MNETEFEDASPVAPALDPTLTAALPVDQLTPAVKQLIQGASPAKLMAARGMAPLRPADLAVALYQLGFDADPAVSQAARKAPELLPDKLLLSMVGEALPAPVLHFLAATLDGHRGELIEIVLYNRAVPDATFVRLAQHLPEQLAEVICQNEQRLLRCPDIVVALFGNPAARMSSVNRAIELCARNGVELDIPAYQDIVKAIQGDPSATDGSGDSAFGSMAQVALIDDEPSEGEEAATPDQPPKEKKKKPGQLDTIIDFTRLKIFEKVRLATFGNAYCRNNLIRDPNRLVAMSVIKSPKIKDTELVAASANRGVHEDVIRYLANQGSLTKKYAIRLNLVNNPKCPLPAATRFLSTLHTGDIKKIAGSRNISRALAATAKRIMQKKEAAS